MTTLVFQLWAALALDFFLGDPRWMPHPVRIMGRTAEIIEIRARKIFRSERLAGIAAAATLIAATISASWGLLKAARCISPVAGHVAAVWMLYTTLAVRDLWGHSRAVFKPLESGSLDQARAAVGRMVGRDTSELDEAGIVRASVESVAENSVDGVLSPIFYALLFGPVGAMAYKAVNTLDSMFGYRNERYLNFGWASARVDDILNFVPARLSVLFVFIGAVFPGGRPMQALRSVSRDAPKHLSPNAGYPEAAFAGALGVQLGGPLIRKGRPDSTPFMGDPLVSMNRECIHRANMLMIRSTLTGAVLLSGAAIFLGAVFR
jgi:adenosylcobinamide-phosphate synthase